MGLSGPKKEEKEKEQKGKIFIVHHIKQKGVESSTFPKLICAQNRGEEG